MASLYERPGSPYWWIRYKTDSGKWKAKATGYRKDNNFDKTHALKLARKQTERERAEKSAGGEWRCWVDAWMADRYGGKVHTLASYGRCWRRLHKWLVKHGIRTPGQLRFGTIVEYRSARLKDGAVNNGIVHDLKFLGVIMAEAVRREYCTANPCIRMGFKRDKAKEKAAWTDDEIMAVSGAIKKQPHWMRCTFILGLYQAARLRQIPFISDIDFEARRITYRIVKMDKPFTHTMDIRAIAPLQRLVAERTESTSDKSLCELPLLASVEWRRFLDTLGFMHLCHHGLRVTWITRAAKAGVHISLAKRFVNHGSTAVHSLYQKLSSDDLEEVTAKLALPVLQ